MSRISGVIRNSQGNPVGMVPIMLTRRNGTGSSGISGMNAGRRFLHADESSARRAFYRSAADPTRKNGAACFCGKRGIRLRSGESTGQDITGLVITTGQGASMSGRLIFDGNSAATAEAPQPLRVVSHLRRPISRIDREHGQDNGVVDESGHFQIRGVNGQVLFRAGAQGWTLKSVTLNGVDITDIPFDAKPSTNITGLEVTMTDRQTIVSGGVTNSRSEPVKDFVVADLPCHDAGRGVMPPRFTRTSCPINRGDIRREDCRPETTWRWP